MLLTLTLFVSYIGLKSLMHIELKLVGIVTFGHEDTNTMLLSLELEYSASKQTKRPCARTLSFTLIIWLIYWVQEAVPFEAFQRPPQGRNVQTDKES